VLFRSQLDLWLVRLGKKGYRIVSNGGRAMARDRKRWKALCKPSTATGRRGLTEGSEVKQLPFGHAF
jgi:hypothetical protein